jgi:molybdopterin converting factor small subunit
MPVVFIPKPLRDLTDGLATEAVEGDTVREVIEALDRLHPGFKSRLCRGDSLRPGLQVSVDDVMTPRGLLAEVLEDSEIHFLPVIGGG